MKIEEACTIFGVEKDDDKKIIQKAFRKKMMLVHPDKNPDNPNAQAESQIVTTAMSLFESYWEKGITDDSEEGENDSWARRYTSRRRKQENGEEYSDDDEEYSEDEEEDGFMDIFELLFRASRGRGFGGGGMGGMPPGMSHGMPPGMGNIFFGGGGGGFCRHGSPFDNDDDDDDDSEENYDDYHEYMRNDQKSDAQRKKEFQEENRKNPYPQYNDDFRYQKPTSSTPVPEPLKEPSSQEKKTFIKRGEGRVKRMGKTTKVYEKTYKRSTLEIMCKSANISFKKEPISVEEY